MNASLPDTVKQELSSFSPLMQVLLFNRGISTREEAHVFLSPDYEKENHDPFLLKDMDKAVDRILEALKDNEKIVIYTDYDTDGIPAGVIFNDFFNKIGFSNFEVYIPHRVMEGFGLNHDAIDQFIAQSVNLIITADCGIGGNGEVQKAMNAGIDVIVTDHHLPGKDLPSAYAIVDPKQEDCRYPEKMLCGSGVAYKLIQALILKGNFSITLGWEKWLLDMVGIATLSDMVPLTGENRVFASYGLKVLRKSPRPGLKTLLEKARINQKELTEDDIGFTIGPRINAASRMGVPMDAFKLLVSTDKAESEMLADHLEHINDERKGVVASIVKAIKHKLSSRDDTHAVIATGDPAWSPSLMGLVANSVVESYGKPAFIWGRGDGKIIKGSCRSNGRVHLLDLMNAVPEGFFIEYGGHAESGGFAIDHEHIHRLEEVLCEAYTKIVVSDKKEKAPHDAVLCIGDISWKLWDEITELAPFGMGNPKPIFLLKDVCAESVETFGKQKNHLKIKLSDESGKRIEAIEFFKTPDSYDIKSGDKISLLAHLEKNTFGYRPELRLRIVDILN